MHVTLIFEQAIWSLNCIDKWTHNPFRGFRCFFGFFFFNVPDRVDNRRNSLDTRQQIEELQKKTKSRQNYRSFTWFFSLFLHFINNTKCIFMCHCTIWLFDMLFILILLGLFFFCSLPPLIICFRYLCVCLLAPFASISFSSTNNRFSMFLENSLFLLLLHRAHFASSHERACTMR